MTFFKKRVSFLIFRLLAFQTRVIYSFYKLEVFLKVSKSLCSPVEDLIFLYAVVNFKILPFLFQIYFHMDCPCRKEDWQLLHRVSFELTPMCFHIVDSRSLKLPKSKAWNACILTPKAHIAHLILTIIIK